MEKRPVMSTTILHLLDLDPEKLTYRFAGRDYRLTDVGGENHITARLVS